MSIDLHPFEPSHGSAIHSPLLLPSVFLHQNAAVPPVRGLSRRALRLALTYIEQHLGDPFTLEDLARAVGVSRFHFARLFRVSTGESPMEFLLRSRIERAKQILVTSDRRMSEIAATLGFCDQSHFSRSFRRYAGVTPRQFARTHGEALQTAAGA
jgi:transcriptional regulator GlxA family with amidase domain